MEDSESENEGQLLIDESAGASKRKAAARKRGPKSKKTICKKKKTLKIVVKPEKSTKERRQSRPKKEKLSDSVTPQAVRTSNRVRKRARRHSPSPVRTKEPPKKKLKVKFKNVKKIKTPAKPKTVQNIKNTNDNGVDIESISDEELNNIQYSSVIIDEDPAVKRQEEPKSKGIKLKLSLGKVLSVDESKLEVAEKHDVSSSIVCSPESTTDDIQTPVVQPLIITKRQDSLSSIEKYDISTHVNSPTSQSNTAADTDSSFYSSSSENHKPLMLKLSVGRPKTVRQYSVAEIEHKTEKAFPNIRRSWSVASASQDQVKPVEPVETVIKKEAKAQNVEEKTVPTPMPQLSTTPYFNAGLQSLLDVVSVELKEQNKNSSDIPCDKSIPPKLPHVQNPLKQPMPLESHFLIRPASNLPKSSENTLANHEGHLPSLSFPKPKLNFVSKKRHKAKAAAKSPEYPSMLLSSVFESKSDDVPDSEVTEELSDKERRRRDKKKVMNSDFVDPDTLISGPEPKQKQEDHAWKKPTSPSHQQKLGGFSLLMPQMMSKHTDSELQGGACRISQKNAGSLVKRPKKGMATAKQRLASKLKIGKTHAY